MLSNLKINCILILIFKYFPSQMRFSQINILGISELKWTGMGEFNSGDHYIYYGARIP